MYVRVSSLLRCNGRIAIRYATTHVQPEDTKGRLSKGTRHNTTYCSAQAREPITTPLMAQHKQESHHNTTYGSAQAREPITTPLMAQHKQESLSQHHLWLSTSKRAYHNTTYGSAQEREPITTQLMAQHKQESHHNTNSAHHRRNPVSHWRKQTSSHHPP